mgnify:CR=1 FL=1
MSQKVLVVEDDINIAELLRLYLQKDGFEVSHAADGGKAVEMAKETSCTPIWCCSISCCP